MVSAPDFAPPPHAYTWSFVVSKTDIDELGHAGNVSWVRWVNDAAIAHSRSVGMTPEEYARLAVLWVVRRHEIDYLLSALEGDAISAVTWVHDMRGATSTRRTLFSRDRDQTVLARAQTTWALIDAATLRPKRIPRDLLARYGFAQPEPRSGAIR